MFSFVNLTKRTLPRIPFEKIYLSLFRENFDISLVFIGEKRSRKLNFTYKGKDTIANVLTFPLSAQEGEIYITLPLRNKALFGLTDRKYMAFLFIHALLHLKGVKHGKEMEKKEEALLEKLL